MGGGKQIKFIHITGAHYPYLIDENAQEVGPDSVSGVQCARGVLCIVKEYFDELRKNGVYDNSNIILAADYGYFWDDVLTNPLFVVKPHDSSGELILNNAPVCQADFVLTDVEYTVRGEKIQHSKYCKTCKNGIPSEGEEYDPPRIIHEKDVGYPE